MLKAKVNIQVLKVDRRLKLYLNIFCEVKRFRSPKWAFSLKSLVRIASYGPQIGQSHGENRLSHIINIFILWEKSKKEILRGGRGVVLNQNLTWIICNITETCQVNWYNAKEKQLKLLESSEHFGSFGGLKLQSVYNFLLHISRKKNSYYRRNLNIDKHCVSQFQWFLYYYYYS